MIARVGMVCPNEFLYIAGIIYNAKSPHKSLIANHAQSKPVVFWLVCQIETDFKMFHHRIDAETSSNKLTVHSVLKQHILLNHIQFNKQLPHGTSILYPSTPFKFKSKRLDCFFSNRVEKYKSNCSCSPIFKVRIQESKLRPLTLWPCVE